MLTHSLGLGVIFHLVLRRRKIIRSFQLFKKNNISVNYAYVFLCLISEHTRKSSDTGGFSVTLFFLQLVLAVFLSLH